MAVAQSLPHFAALNAGYKLRVLLASEFRELFRHPLIDIPFERDDQRGQLFQTLPAPRREFRLVTSRVIDIDFAVVAVKAHREPFLRLSAIFAFPGLADGLVRDIVSEPVRDFGKLL